MTRLQAARTSIGALQQLDRLARTIRSRYEAAGRLSQTAKERGREAVAEAILCGQALNEAKSIVGHGGWLKWLEEHCKGVCYRTAQNYMRVANTKAVSHLDSYESLKDIYVDIGILPEPTPKSKTRETSEAAPGATCEDRDHPRCETKQPLHGVNGRSLCWSHAAGATAESATSPFDVLAPSCNSEPAGGLDVPPQSEQCVIGHCESKSQTAIPDDLRQQRNRAECDHYIRMVLQYTNEPWFSDAIQPIAEFIFHSTNSRLTALGSPAGEWG